MRFSFPSFLSAANSSAFGKNKWTLYFLGAVLLSSVLSACDAQSTGISKNAGTGMVTTWKGITTSETKMVMNDEVLNHHEIPLGEKFVIINGGVKGLTIKNKKVSLGCSLTITDKAGKIMLNEEDLFKGADLFESDKLDYLRCSVNTGKPMEWEKEYIVKVVFWDKYGTGRLSNTVAINMQDVP